MTTARLYPSNVKLSILEDEFIEQFGRAGSQFLGKLHYWLSNERCGVKYENTHWIYNTAEEWAKQLKLSVRHTYRLLSKFVNLGIIRVKKLHRIKSVRTNYVTIDYDILDKYRSSSITEEAIKTDVSSAKMSGSSCHDVSMYIHRLPTKIINKSEDYPQDEEVSKQELGNMTNKQVEQVKDQKFNREEELEKDYDDKNHGHKPKNTTAQDMLATWNYELGHKSKEVMSGTLAPLLVEAYKRKFNEDQKQWAAYCKLITTSDYLMGEVFKLTLEWALSFKTIDRLMRGELGVKYSIGIIKNEEAEDEMKIKVERSINFSNESEKIKNIRRKLAKAIPPGEYISWFSKAEFFEQDGKVNISTPNAYVARIWDERYSFLTGHGIYAK